MTTTFTVKFFTRTMRKYTNEAIEKYDHLFVVDTWAVSHRMLYMYYTNEDGSEKRTVIIPLRDINELIVDRKESK